MSKPSIEGFFLSTQKLQNINPCTPDVRGDSHVDKDKAWDAGNLLLSKAITFVDIDTASEFNATPKHEK